MFDMTLEPGNSYFASGKAAIEPIRTVPAVPSNVKNTVLKIYLEKGIHELPIIVNRSLKLSSVGFCTKSFGGNRNISFKGLNALLIIKTKGKILNNPKEPKNIVRIISTARFRLGLLILLDA